MRRYPFLLTLLVSLTLTIAFIDAACFLGSAPDKGSGGAGGAGSASAGGAGGGIGGAGGTLADGGPVTVCMIEMGADPVGFCTQKLVLGAEHMYAYKPATGVAQSWDATSLKPDVAPDGGVYHDPRDDAAYAASCARYHTNATVYGDTNITGTLDQDLEQLATLLTTELTPTPSGYSGELYLDLRTASLGLAVLGDTDGGTDLDALAESYGRAIHDASYVVLGTGDGGVTSAVLGTPADGGTAYAPADDATGALALVDLAVRHVSDDPANAAIWQAAAANVFAYLNARARDPGTGLYYAALITSADTGNDALAPAAAGGPPADALLTEVNGRIALAYIRAQQLALGTPAAAPAVVALPLEGWAEAVLTALDGTTPQNGLYDDTAGGYYTGWVPSTQQILTDKPTRANAILMAALHDALVYGNGPDPMRPVELLGLFTNTAKLGVSLIGVVPGQNGYFLTVPPDFDWDQEAGAIPRLESYYSIANTSTIEGLTELWVPNQP
jgi:hypothetical protein